jgi:hypothetical protein
MRAFILMALLSGTSLAQGSQSRGWVYGFGAVVASPGISGTATSVGLGGEVRVKGHIALVADLGSFETQTFTNRIFLLSTNVAYHFDNAMFSRKLVPFVTGGLTIANGCACGMNAGGGAQYWATEHVGARFEIRTYGVASDLSSPHEFRFGVAFR